MRLEVGLSCRLAGRRLVKIDASTSLGEVFIWALQAAEPCLEPATFGKFAALQHCSIVAVDVNIVLQRHSIVRRNNLRGEGACRIRLTEERP
jgi:hypothetical protein